MPSRLLIVDDHEIVRLGIRTLFANDDSIEVCGESENGMDAIHMVSDLSPDVVILDLTMPGMNGFETAERMLLIAPSVQIIFFSAHEIPATARWLAQTISSPNPLPYRNLRARSVARSNPAMTWGPGRKNLPLRIPRGDSNSHLMKDVKDTAGFSPQVSAFPGFGAGVNIEAKS